MKIFTILFALTVISFPGLASDSQKGHGSHGTNFFPKKEANRALATRPSAPELLEPKALSQVTGTQVTLQWKAVENADSYRLQVATDPNFKWLLEQRDSYPETSFNLTGLEAGKHYYWRVYAWKNNQEPGSTSSFSSVSSFEVK